MNCLSLPAPCLHATVRQVSGNGFTCKTAAGELSSRRRPVNQIAKLRGPPQEREG